MRYNVPVVVGCSVNMNNTSVNSQWVCSLQGEEQAEGVQGVGC